jgi:hemerythrin superfamily protein
MSVPPYASAGTVDAVAILLDDHIKIKKHFRDFRLLYLAGGLAEAEQVAQQICRELTVHTTLEEEIFYPEARATIDTPELIDEAKAGHAIAKELIALIMGGSIADKNYAARVGMLAEYVSHHVREEQQELFPKVRQSELDMNEIGARMLARKLDLEAEIAVADKNDLIRREGADGEPGGQVSSASRAAR